MTIDLDRIANLAGMATKGPWRVERDDAWHGQYVMAGTVMVADVPMFGGTCSADCDLIAALSPDAVLRLVAVCRAAKRLRAAIDMAEANYDAWHFTKKNLPSHEVQQALCKECVEADKAMVEALAALDGVES